MSLMEDSVHLGHTRLSIIDLTDAAHQPMSSSDAGLWIVYNGEVYNYIEIRAELEQLGYVFHTRSDTEVILKAYQAWGVDCLPRFNGMFAFALIDTSRKRIFAARDRLGVKPLYYHVIPGALICLASEIKQFTALPAFKPQINPQRLFDYLARGMLDHTAETMFRDVYQLRGGQYLLADIDPTHAGFAHPHIHTWWTLPENAPDTAISFPEATREFQRLLEDSVRLRLRSDVPVGSCLSGGLDSSTIVCMVNRILGRERSTSIQNTFSSCFEDPRYDEREYIKAVVDHTEVNAHYMFPDPGQLFTLLDNIIWHQDEPFASTSIFAQWHVFDLAGGYPIKVMLDGQGADELLGGYHGFLWAWLAGLIHAFDLTGFREEFHAIRSRHGYRLKDALINLGYIFSPRRIRPLGRSLLGRPDRPEWMQPHIIDHYDLSTTEGIPEPSASIRSLSRKQLLQTTLPALLHYEDRNSMAHSVEARVPFLDYRLVEFVYSLPDPYKIKDGETKKILRQAIEDLVPDKVRQRQDKMGFVTPEEQWIRDSHRPLFHAMLKSATETLPAWLIPARIESHFQAIANGSRPFDWSIWRIINAGRWIKRFQIDCEGAL